jgi:hypothetical protein
VRYWAIHFDGYGAEGIASPAFEIDAEGPETVPQAVFRIAGVDESEIIRARGQLRATPKVSAGDLAWLTGGQHVGFLARKDDDEIVYGLKGSLAEDDQFPWQSLNPDSYWTGDPEDDLVPRPWTEPVGSVSNPDSVAEPARTGPRWIALDALGYYGPLIVPQFVFWAKSPDAVPKAIEPYNEFTASLVDFARELMEEGAPASEIALRASTGHRGHLICADEFDPNDPWWYTGDRRHFDEERWNRANANSQTIRPVERDPRDDAHIDELNEEEIARFLDKIAREELDTWNASSVLEEREDIQRLDALDDPTLLERIARAELTHNPRYPWFDLLARALFAQGRWSEAQEAMFRERPEIELDDPAHVQQFVNLLQSRIERESVTKRHRYLVDSVNEARERYRDLDYLLMALTDLAQLDPCSMDPKDALLPQQAWARLAVRFLVRASRETGWYPRRTWFNLNLRERLKEAAEPSHDRPS